MRSVQASILACALVGLVLGLSSGVAFGGNAYNGAIIFVPIGALIGWLTARRTHSPTTMMEQDEHLDPPRKPVPSTLEKVVQSLLVLLATLWNAQIALLAALNILPVFVRQPWLFFVLAMLVALVFPPFLGLYFFAYVGAVQLGASEQTGYKASV